MENQAATKKNKDWVLARDLLLKATLKDPHHKWAWNNLGRAYAALGNTDEAVRAYQQQIEINPHDEYAYKGLGWVYAWKLRSRWPGKSLPSTMK